MSPFTMAHGFWVHVLIPMVLLAECGSYPPNAQTIKSVDTYYPPEPIEWDRPEVLVVKDYANILYNRETRNGILIDAWYDTEDNDVAPFSTQQLHEKRGPLTVWAVKP